MLYAGQEIGEPANGSMGFSVNGNTSIFDYCAMPEFQKWFNNGNCDGGKLDDSQRHLRDFYSTLLNAVLRNEALQTGEFYELMLANEHQSGFDTKLYIYMRYTAGKRVLVIANFSRYERNFTVKLPADLLQKLNLSGSYDFNDLLTGNRYHSNDISQGVNIFLPPTSGMLLKF